MWDAIARCCILKVNEMTDTERLNWLAKDNVRLEDVRYRMENEYETIREAIDALKETVDDLIGESSDVQIFTQG